jgi:hypothetical protein
LSIFAIYLVALAREEVLMSRCWFRIQSGDSEAAAERMSVIRSGREYGAEQELELEVRISEHIESPASELWI